MQTLSQPLSTTASLSALQDEANFFPTNRKRWTRTDCDFLERVGLLTERYELLDGEIILKVGQNRPHTIVVTRLFGWLIAVFGLNRVQCQGDIEVAGTDQERNRPQPDIAVLVRPDIEFSQTPRGSDTLIVVEVSDTTLRDDLNTKAALYARNGVPEYWVMDVQSRRLIAHRNPVDGAYSEIVAYSEDENLSPQAAPEQTIRVGDLLSPLMATGE